MIKYRPDNIARAADATRQEGAVEVTPRPIVATNAKRIDEIAVATRALRIIGVQLTYRARGSSVGTISFSSHFRQMNQTLGNALLEATTDRDCRRF
jgi:hypothetical protein